MPALLLAVAAIGWAAACGAPGAAASMRQASESFADFMGFGRRRGDPQSGTEL